MKKLSKKRIDEVAAKLRVVFRAANNLTCGDWKALDTYNKNSWRTLATFVLTDDLKPNKRVGGLAAPKACKVVRGKKVCE